ncbi:unnamed protein product [Diamesa serratosioi]
MTIYKYFCNGDFTPELDVDIQEQLESIYQSTQDILESITFRQSAVEAESEDQYKSELGLPNPSGISSTIEKLRNRINKISKRNEQSDEQSTALMSPVLAALGSLLHAAEYMSQ